MRSISKIVLAGAVASACGYAAAATLSGSVTPYSLESAQLTAGTATVVYSGQAASTSGTAGAGATLRIATAVVATGQRLQINSVGATRFGSVDAHTATFTCSASTQGTSSVTFVVATGASSSTAIVYDVTAASGPTTGASCVIPSIAFLASSLQSAGDVQVSGLITVINTGATIDTFTASTLASVGNEFAVTVVSSLDAVIDVASNRLTFASGTEATSLITGGYTDNFAVNVASTAKNTIGGSYSGTFNLSLTANPDFAFLNDNAASGVCTAGSGSGQATAFGAATTGTISALSPTSAGCNTFTAQWTTILPGVYQIGLGRPSGNNAASTAGAFAVTSYTAGYSFRNVSSTATLTATNGSASLAAGSWTQNGTTANLQYVPVSSTIPLQIIISNTSGTAGAATFTAFSGGATCTGSLGAVNANSTTAVGNTLRSALLGQASGTSNCSSTFTNAEGRAAVSIVSTTPSASTRVHSAFTVTGDTNPRAIIINSTN